jgi:hypothetical protein
MSIEQNIENLEIRNANVVTFVGSSSTIVDTISGRIQCKGFQHNSNVITDISGPHGRVAPTLKKYPEIIFADGKFDRNDTTNTYVQAGYTVTANSTHENRNHEPWKIFDGSQSNEWQISTSQGGDRYSESTGTYNTGVDLAGVTVADQTYNGDWVQVSLPKKIKVDHMNLATPATYGDSRMPEQGVLVGSNNGSSWSNVASFGQVSYPDGSFTRISINSAEYYSYYRMIWLTVTAGDDSTHRDRAALSEWELHGYEENPPAGDHSVDTTFKSRFNNPQLTGVQIFVDGKGSGSNQISGGPDVTGTTTYNESGKHWELNGQLTSNITMEANTFLEGDQPHAVSVWFNSSNLEANVSNTCVFSIASEEKLDSVNLDLQSNTWHNLTYAYQGEGGSRVTYLDGRKVAEDQAEDTFGDYPHLAMTGYSQGGYVASASSDLSATYHAWEVFNNSALELWICAPLKADGTTPRYTGGITSSGGGVYQGPVSTDSIPISGSGSETILGEYIQIEFPFKFKLEDIAYQREGEYWGYNRLPHSGSIVACNDGINWKTIHNWTGLTDADVGSTDGSNLAVTQAPFRSGIFAVDKSGATYDAYKFFRIICTRIQKTDTSGEGNSYGLWSIVQLELYGHRENDLVRLPDPTNVLKYPHIAMTGPAQRGYVASASGYNVGAGRPAWRAFDDLKNAGTLWQLSGTNDVTTNGYNLTPPYNANNNSPTINDNNNNPHLGAWIKLQLPRAIKLSSMNITATTAERRPDSAILLGSNDDSVWYVIKDTFSLVDQDDNTIPVSTSSYYKYVMFLIKSLSGNDGQINIHNIEYYGTEEASSVPIQIGGGNIDKVANFRVYDKFIGEDQVNEIWNAQKEEFGRAKPQMVLQQGKLGIGTDAPQGSLSVADEPDPDAYGLQEFPPKPLVGYKTHIEGHGEFCVSASSPLPGGGSYQPWYLFNKQFLGVNFQSTTWNSTTAFTSATGLVNSGAKLGNFSGEWVQLELPYKIKLKSFRLSIRQYWYQYAPGNYVIAAYDEDTTSWVELASYTGEEWEPKTGSGGDSEGIKNKHIGSTSYYKRYAIVISKLYNPANNRSDLNIAEWKLFGTREQLPPKQSVLHDGQLTLTKSLTVPRIGPALDADDTPRRDRLVVEYNTSTNPTFDGAVRDTSGRGNDGVFYNGASYDASAKAFNFDGTTSDQYVHTLKNGTSESGNIDYSVSLWFNPTTVNVSRWRAIFAIGVLDRTQPTDNNGDEISMYVKSGGNVLHLQNGGNSFETTDTLTPGRWVHIVLTYDGTYRKIYLDGSLSVSHGYSALNLPKEMLIRLAQSIPAGGSENDEYMDCKISNFKTWFGAALTAEEVKTLYDMGRCDEGHHVVNFSKTRVGIGLGDGQAPRSALDVRDQIYARTTTIGTFTGQHICFPDESMEKGLIVSAKKNKFVKLNGLATGKSAITIDESLPIVSLSNVAQDKACFGVVSKMEESNAAYRTEITGGLVSESIKIAGDNRAIVNSVGEGAIWVVNTGGSLESGDYITTSNVAGYGQKQDGAGLMNYTVAKITMDCDFTASNVAVQTIKREETGLRTITEDTWNQLVDYDRSSNTETQYSNTLVSSDYSGQSGYTPREVTTIMDYTDGSNLISTAEWSNLESNIQNTYQSNTFTEIVDYTKFVNLSEWSNLTAETQATYSEAEITTYYQIQRGENVLDENGQLQWEDKTGATEAPYEKRFLAADGTQTDEANAVHIAAFVGCTYHCG